MIHAGHQSRYSGRIQDISVSECHVCVKEIARLTHKYF